LTYLIEDLNWKVATQLPHLKDNNLAPQTCYILWDSPTELKLIIRFREFNIDNQTVKLALHDPETEGKEGRCLF